MEDKALSSSFSASLTTVSAGPVTDLEYRVIQYRVLVVFDDRTVSLSICPALYC